MTNVPDAVAAATQKGKPLFIAFVGSDWSAASQDTLKDALDTRSFKEYADANLVLLKVDFTRKGLTLEMEKAYTELARQLNVDHFPVFMIADPAHARGLITNPINSYNLGPGGASDFVAQISSRVDVWHSQMAAIQAQAQMQAQAKAAAPSPTLPQAGGISALPSAAELFHHDQSIATSPPTAPGLSSTPSAQSFPSFTPAGVPTVPGGINQPPNSRPASVPAGSTDTPTIQLK